MSRLKNTVSLGDNTLEQPQMMQRPRTSPDTDIAGLRARRSLRSSVNRIDALGRDGCDTLELKGHGRPGHEQPRG
jgi:hypothetical protein